MDEGIVRVKEPFYSSSPLQHPVAPHQHPFTPPFTPLHPSPSPHPPSPPPQRSRKDRQLFATSSNPGPGAYHSDATKPRAAPLRDTVPRVQGWRGPRETAVGTGNFVSGSQRFPDARDGPGPGEYGSESGGGDTQPRAPRPAFSTTDRLAYQKDVYTMRNAPTYTKVRGGGGCGWVRVGRWSVMCGIDGGCGDGGQCVCRAPGISHRIFCHLTSSQFTSSPLLSPNPLISHLTSPHHPHLPPPPSPPPTEPRPRRLRVPRPAPEKGLRRVSIHVPPVCKGKGPVARARRLQGGGGGVDGEGSAANAGIQDW